MIETPTIPEPEPQLPNEESNAAACRVKTSLGPVFVLGLAVLFAGITHYSSSPLRNIIQRQPLFHCDNNPTGTDSTVFLYIGRLILRGGVPYRDAFDHKGPLVYLLDALGIAIHGVFGVWLLEILFLSVSATFAYKIARAFTSQGTALMTAVVSILWYTARSDSNFCETWSVPFLLIALYYWTRYLREGFSLSKRATMSVGFSFGAVLLLKPNLTAIWMLFCLTVLIASICRGTWRFLVTRILVFLIGAAILVVPILGWLRHTGAWNDFVDQYWVFNRFYCDVAFGMKLRTFLRCFACIPLESYFALFAAIGYPILAYRAKNRSDRILFVSLEICLFLSLLLMSMSGRSARHYSAPLVAVFLPFLACAFTGALSESSSAWGKIGKRVFLLILLVPTLCYDIPMFRPVRDMTKMAILRRVNPDTDYSKFRRVYGYPYFYEEFDAAEIGDWLKENTEPETRIASFGIGGRIFYWYSDRRCVTKYFYIRDTHLERGYLPKIVAELKEKAPEVFIFQLKGGYPSSLTKQEKSSDSGKVRKIFEMPGEIRDWLDAEGYRKVFENDAYEVYRK
jgi:hypothetical protein